MANTKSEMAAVKTMLKKHPDLQINGERVMCSLTGHEMPISAAAVQFYISGTKYKRFKSLKDTLDSHQQYFQDKGVYLQCLVTGKRLSKVGSDIMRHVEGKRFKRRLEKFNNGEMGTDSDDTSSKEAQRTSDVPYPEFEDSGLSEEGDNEFNAMDTDHNTNGSSKRPKPQDLSSEAPRSKKRRH